MFYTITNELKYQVIADAILHREQEIFGYDFNITNYETMLTTMPNDEWPEHIAAYKYVGLEQVPDQYDDIVNQYQFRDRVRHLLKSERAERAKSYSIYQALIAQIPSAELDATMAAAIARKTAAQTP